ncbi:mobile mystery protein B [Candidatus Poriferisodalis sp.]|uniref:mobile mystery protein B n=1 Tax=Candidatus Poriferisodalis sp. TaxID=3101277 RepID=UPI003B59CFBE
MSNLAAPLGDGHTLLSDEDRAGLLQPDIATRQELSDAEQRNIAKALLRPKPRLPRLLDDKYLRGLHKAMFGDVWDWAGRYRTSDTNIGIELLHISAAVRDVTDDAAAWVEHETYEPDELAVRFHHRLVFIHPFVNGNGRHSRISADLLIVNLGRHAFSWGSNLDVTTDELRQRYLAALHSADAGRIDELVSFARS